MPVRWCFNFRLLSFLSHPQTLILCKIRNTSSLNARICSCDICPVVTLCRTIVPSQKMKRVQYTSLVEQVNTTVNSTVSLLSLSLSLFWSDSADSNLSSVKRLWGCIRHYLQGARERILHYKVKYLNMGLGWKEVFGKPVWNKLNTSPWGVTLKKRW